jgi:hypothetical protein
VDSTSLQFTVIKGLHKEILSRLGLSRFLTLSSISPNYNTDYFTHSKQSNSLKHFQKSISKLYKSSYLTHLQLTPHSAMAGKLRSAIPLAKSKSTHKKKKSKSAPSTTTSNAATTTSSLWREDETSECQRIGIDLSPVTVLGYHAMDWAFIYGEWMA